MDIRALLLGLTFALMWSSAFTSARIIVAEAPPLLSLSLRFAISGGLGIAIAYALGQRMRLTAGQWRAVMIFGVCQNALYLGLNFVAMQWIEASLAAIIASCLPLSVALVNWVLFSERTRLLGVAGLLAGTLGVVLIMGTRLQGGADPTGIA
ncbi:MAG: DMT family transporter, partial [Pseudomonadota bacterium]